MQAKWGIAEVLIDANAVVFYSESDICRDNSPVFLACEKDNADLIDRISNMNEIYGVWNSQGETPLSFSFRTQKLNAYNYLAMR